MLAVVISDIVQTPKAKSLLRVKVLAAEMISSEKCMPPSGAMPLVLVAKVVAWTIEER